MTTSAVCRLSWSQPLQPRWLGSSSLVTTAADRFWLDAGPALLELAALLLRGSAE